MRAEKLCQELALEANTAVKDEGKAERKAVTQKKAMPGKERNRRFMNV